MRVFGLVNRYNIFLGLITVFLFHSSAASASVIPAEGLNVGTTYYGGHYDEKLQSWVIDNHNQCTRIRSGQLDIKLLSAQLDTDCNDDNGLGYIGSIPLHNQVSYAELSNDYKNPDYAALGNLPAGTKLLIEYQNRCLIAEKRDVGQGGEPVYGVHRSLDLWWQTARSLDFKNGYDIMKVKTVDQQTALTPLGQSYACSPVPNTVSNASTSEQINTISGSTVKQKQNISTKPDTVKPLNTKVNTTENSGSEVLGAIETTNSNVYVQPTQFTLNLPWLIFALTVLLSLPFYVLIKHKT